MNSAGIAPSEKYGVFKTRVLKARFPEMDAFSQKWSETLNRDVNFVGYPAPQPRDVTEYLLRGGK